MRDIKVKICGITNLQDALASSEAGADAIGFVFYEGSQRYCSPEKAKLISKKTPPFLTKVGLFVNHDKNFIHDILDQNIIDVIQFHGHESNDFCKSFNFPFIKVIPVEKSTDIVKISEEFIDASSILLDTFDTKHYGGSGKSFDWSLIPKNIAKPIIVAGGLNVEANSHIGKLLDSEWDQHLKLTRSLEPASCSKCDFKVGESSRWKQESFVIGDRGQI